jgi:hypothetical protein
MAAAGKRLPARLALLLTVAVKACGLELQAIPQLQFAILLWTMASIALDVIAALRTKPTGRAPRTNRRR